MKTSFHYFLERNWSLFRISLIRDFVSSVCPLPLMAIDVLMGFSMDGHPEQEFIKKAILTLRTRKFPLKTNF